MADDPHPDRGLADSPMERTARGHDMALLREMLTLTPEERIRRNARWVMVVEALRDGLKDDDGPGTDLPKPL